MKHRLFFAVCCLLLFTGLNAAAQEKTAPLPPPGQDGSGPLPAPDGQPGAQAPAQSGTARSTGTGTGGSASQPSGSQARSSAPAAQPAAPAARPAAPAAQPAAAAAASTQTGIPEKGMFWGGMIGGSGYFYSYDYDGSDNYELYGEGGFNAGLLWGYDFGLLALQGELLLTGESAKSYFYYSYPYSSYTQTEYSAMGLRIPLMVKLDLHWWRLMFQPQAGLYLNFGLGDMDYETYDGGSVVASGSVGYDSPLFGVMFGGALGVRIGRGYLFLDLRYARDLGETGVEGFKFTRSAVMGNFGYQYYFKSKQ